MILYDQITVFSAEVVCASQLNKIHHTRMKSKLITYPRVELRMQQQLAGNFC